MPELNKTIDRSIDISRNVAAVLDRRAREAFNAYGERVRKAQRDFFESSAAVKTPQQICAAWFDYAVVFSQRMTLFFVRLRNRGNNWIAHEQAAKPPLF